jgi:hypothetical protein
MLRRLIVENASMVYDKTRSLNRKFNPQTHKTWRAVERRLRGHVVVEVNELPLSVPKYSCSLSAARIDDNGQVIDMNRHLPMHAIPGAIEILQEIYAKYTEIRAVKQEEFDIYRAGRAEYDRDANDDDDVFRATEPLPTRRTLR